MEIRALPALAVLVTSPMAAQLAPFNSAGVTLGHVHLNVHNIEVQQRFWLELGGKPFENKNLLPQRMIEFRGIYLILRQQDSSGGNAGSVIGHFGFRVQNLGEWLPKWNAAGLNIHEGKLPGRVMLTGPDDVRVEIIEDRSIPTPIAMHHVHLFLPDPSAAQAWYIKVFGAVASSRTSGSGGQYLLANVTGAEFTFTKTDQVQAPTKGRALDHIGFDVKDLDQFVQRLNALGIQTEYPIRKSTNDPSARVTHITDPWGTRIELTEGSPRIQIRSAPPSN